MKKTNKVTYIVIAGLVIAMMIALYVDGPMTDVALLYGSTILALLFNIVLFRLRKWYGIMSLIIQLLYSGYCYYWYFYEYFHEGTGGTGFAAYMFVLFCNCFLIVVVVVVLSIILFRRNG